MVLCMSWTTALSLQFGSCGRTPSILSRTEDGSTSVRLVRTPGSKGECVNCNIRACPVRPRQGRCLRLRSAWRKRGSAPASGKRLGRDTLWNQACTGLTRTLDVHDKRVVRLPRFFRRAKKIGGAGPSLMEEASARFWLSICSGYRTHHGKMDKDSCRVHSIHYTQLAHKATRKAHFSICPYGLQVAATNSQNVLLGIAHTQEVKHLFSAYDADMTV